MLISSHNQQVEVQAQFPRKVNENLTKIYFYLHYDNQAKISHKSIRLLQLLEKRDAVTVGDVASFLHISPNTASENVKRLVKGRFVKKVSNPEDERQVILNLTETGREIVRLNTYYDEGKLAQIFETMSPDDTQTVLDGFSLLSQACEKQFAKEKL